MTPRRENLDKLLAEIRACRVCAPFLPHGVRPIIRASKTAKLLIAAQAPGIRVHETGLSFNDPSGDRLRDWLGVDRETFYDESRISIVGMGFCFPGYTDAGADKPPRPECAPLWQARLQAALPQHMLTLAIGTYAINWYLGDARKSTMTETVQAWREYGPVLMPLPHPSWRNNAWLKKNPWFEKKLLPDLRARVRHALDL
jgi:uracil-DNA glycosylase